MMGEVQAVLGVTRTLTETWGFRKKYFPEEVTPKLSPEE